MALDTSKPSGWKQYVSKWTTPKGIASMILFLTIVIILESLIVYSSMSFGLNDDNPLVWNVFSFTISISPLFHLLPLSVIVVLFFSWIYLTRHVAITYHKAEPTTIRQPPPRKIKKVRFRTLRRYYKRISRRLADFGRRIKETVLGSRIAKYLGQAVIKSAWTVIFTFIVLALFVYFVVYPWLIPNATTSIFGEGSIFLGFVVWTINAANWLGQALSPLGWVAANINNGLVATSPGFRSAVIGLTTPIVKPLIDLDLIGKYVLVQNIAAWFSALVAQFYAQYASRPRIVRRK
jgi:hypothetical protein